MIIDRSEDGQMSLRLEPDGTGYAMGIPQGRQKWADNACIELLAEERYTGEISWEQRGNFAFEIWFADSRYLVTDGPGKMAADWTEVRIFTCDSGYEYWFMGVTCGQSDLFAREPPSCS